jgi:predicted acetyltransferase
MRSGNTLGGHSAPENTAAPVVDKLSTKPSAGSTAAGLTRSKKAALPEAGPEEYVWPIGVAAGEPPAPSGETAAREACEVSQACAGDHPAIQQMLSAVFHAPSRDEFSASLEDPLYEPCDRLIIKRGSRLVGHAHVAQRVMRFQGESLPVSAVHRLAVLPEFRGRGFGKRLLDKIDESLTAEGSALGVLTTRSPHFFRSHGWAVCVRHSHAEVGARDLLAQLSARGFAPHDAFDAVAIRPWRHVELPSLVRLYGEQTARACGPYERTEAYWRWLVGRQAAENIFVALAGPKRHDFDFHDDSIVGYVIQRDDRILELVASQRHPGVAERLLARACGEAIERDHHIVRLHLAADDRLWNIVEDSAAELHRSEASRGEVTMVKIVDPEAFLERSLPTIHARATAAQQADRLRKPVEIGMAAGELRWKLTVTARSASVERVTNAKGALGRNVVKLGPADLTRMLLGHLDLMEAAAAGRLKATSAAALQTAAALFPQLPLWRPPLDDLLV